MNNTEDNQIVGNILAEFEKSNSQINDLLRIQNELSHAENELIALQIRYVHKCKENEDLKLQLDKKNKLLNEKLTDSECKLERFQSLEFHYNDLIQKHKFCLDCMSKQNTELEFLKEKNENLIKEKKRLESDQNQLRELFGDQVNDLEINIKKLIEENNENLDSIKKLHNNNQTIQNELDKMKNTNLDLIQTNDNLKDNLNNLKDQYDRNIGDKCYKIDQNEEKINNLQLELARSTSKLDEANFQFNEMKNNYLNQLKISESVQKNCQKKDLQYEELKMSYEKCLYEIQMLNQINLNQKHEFEEKLNELIDKTDSSTKYLEIESNSLKKQKRYYETIIKKQTVLYNEQQSKLESLVTLFKTQDLHIKNLKEKIQNLDKIYKNLKLKYTNLHNECDQNNILIKSLQEKCFDLETKYSEKCEHLNTLERENYLTQNSLESAMNDLTNLSNIITNKNEEIIIKNQTIDRLESINNQLNIELNKRKAEINERINQIEVLDKHLKEEKTVLDLKMAHLEANLKSKSKQLNQRIEQIKEMNDVVNNLKEEKDQVEYKLEQFENVIKCQKLEIESKTSLIKQLELRIQDSKNEINHIKIDMNQKLNQEIENYQKELNKQKKLGDIKQTQTDLFEKDLCSIDENNFDTESSYNNEKLIIEDLKHNLKIKETLIHTINDSIILKDAEIAKLKSKIALIERKDNI